MTRLWCLIFVCRRLSCSTGGFIIKLILLLIINGLWLSYETALIYLLYIVITYFPGYYTNILIRIFTFTSQYMMRFSSTTIFIILYLYFVVWFWEISEKLSFLRGISIINSGGRRFLQFLILFMIFIIVCSSMLGFI